MSKSLGNVVDPVEVIGQYGTDALRFTLATGTLFDTAAISLKSWVNEKSGGIYSTSVAPLCLPKRCPSRKSTVVEHAIQTGALHHLTDVARCTSIPSQQSGAYSKTKNGQKPLPCP